MSSEAHPLVALVTAGTAGVGAATARLFSRQGMRVVVNYSSNSERAERLVDELHAISPLPTSRDNFMAIKADVAERAELTRLVEDAVTAMGRLDVVFSNAGWTRFRNINDLNDNVVEDDWDRCFNMNVKSHLFLMHAARPHLDQAEGSFITTASLAGLKVSGSSLAYSVTKAAQIHLVKGLAVAAGPKIRVNCVSPGLMLTDWGHQFSEEKQEQVRQSTRLQRLPTVEDVAEQVLCFVRSSTVTGANAVIDAGISL
ncbi:short-chain dehydrogenase [Paramyrothecium foliicola]|nr:short-chain dehydrogenase [Paramyrothecium foliicola]